MKTWKWIIVAGLAIGSQAVAADRVQIVSPDTRTFTATMDNGQTMPVASLGKGFFGLGRYIKPLPGTEIASTRSMARSPWF